MSKTKKILLISYIVFFFVICIVPIALFPFTNNSEMIEKKTLASVPSFTKDGFINMDFSTDCNAYINDHFPYRSELLFASNHMLSDVFKSPTANVITGKNGWLFFEETADDYMGTNTMSDSELNATLVTLSLINEQVSANGGNFVFAPIPNKNSIYSSYMPAFYAKSANTNLSKLYELLDGSDINYVNLRNEFNTLIAENNSLPSDSSITYYHKKDSHWNNLGAQAGFNAIMKSIDEDHTSSDLSYTPDYNWDGDLEKLLYPKWWNKDLQYNMEYNMVPYTFTTPSSSLSTEELLAELMSDKEENDTTITSKHAEASSNSELYMVRDSFGRALLPFMINEYDTATFVRTNCPYIATLNEGCDVVYEIVERNLSNITSTAPYMYAPLRDNITSPLLVSDSILNAINSSDEGYAYRLYGTIDKEILGSDSRIYIKLANDEITYTFEAFPIYEKSLLGDTSDDIFGYSLMLNTDDIESGDYDVCVISGNHMTENLTTINILSGASSSEDGADINEEEIPIFNEHDLSSAEGFELIAEKSSIICNHTAIHLGDNINDLKDSLGKMSAPSIDVESCITGDTATEYYYPYLTIDTLEDGTIFSIDVKENGYTGDIPVTTLGISLGSTTDELDELIGSDYLVITNDPVCYTYNDESISIYYYFDNNGISNISLTDTGYQDAADIEAANGYTPLANGKFVIGDYTNNLVGWKLVNGAYEYYDPNTLQRLTGTIINGVVINPDGSISHDENTIARIDVMMKARWVIENNTLPTDTLEEKRLKVFNWVLSFPYKQHRKLNQIYKTTPNLDILFANDMFVYGSGDCVSESAAVAILFRELGYSNVYFCHDTGHSWVMMDGYIFDPLFAESRGFDKNYNVIPTDYRKGAPHKILIP